MNKPGSFSLFNFDKTNEIADIAVMKSPASSRKAKSPDPQEVVAEFEFDTPAAAVQKLTHPEPRAPAEEGE